MSHGVYVHIPWCRRRCPYCAFYVEADHGVPWDRFTGALTREHEARRPAYGGLGKTLYLGGGTPSRMPLPQLQALVHALGGQADEITIEANPEDIDGDWLTAVRGAGVTRLSLGLQTFNPRYARMLNRNATVEQARAIAGEVARAGFTSWSVDLIFALPGQTLDELAVDLDAILATEPPHVSLYGLTYEPGTPFARARDRGTFTPASDDTWRRMYDLLVDRMARAGLARYEVSNFARVGHRSHHNQGYWTHRPYMGLGPSAHGLEPGGARYVNDPDATAYIDGAVAPCTTEHPDARTEALDRLAGGLRGVEGLDLRLLGEATGWGVQGPVVDALVGHGLLDRLGATIRLTDDGFPVADSVVTRLARALQRTT